MRRLWRSIQLLPRLTANHASILSDLHRYDEAMAELNRLIAVNPEFPVYYQYRGIMYWRMGNQDAFVADWVMGLKKTGRPEMGGGIRCWI